MMAELVQAAKPELHVTVTHLFVSRSFFLYINLFLVLLSCIYCGQLFVRHSTVDGSVSMVSLK